ncbi:MAG: isoprenylcysteine carboxylmethyltransferase family protein [Pseudohongiellaceae bacterium]
MNLYQILIALIYGAIVASLIWARFRFFKITNNKSKLVSYFNDPAVMVQIFFTFAYILEWEAPAARASLIALLCYLGALLLFWWAIGTAGELDFASSGGKGQIITSGAFALVRHPFYLSYIIVWATNSILFNSIYLWVSLIILLGVYFYSARAEESAFAASDFAAEYQAYKARVGMLVPKIVSVSSTKSQSDR